MPLRRHVSSNRNKSPDYLYHSSGKLVAGMLTSAQRLYAAVSNGVPDRVPVVPKIFVESAARLTGTSILDVIQDPFTALQVVLDAGLLTGVDAVRQFHLPSRRIEKDGERVFEVDQHCCRVGEIDIQGGLTTRLQDPTQFHLEDTLRMSYMQYSPAEEPYVKSLDDVTTGNGDSQAWRSHRHHRGRHFGNPLFLRLFPGISEIVA